MTLLAVNGLEAGYGPIQVLRDVGFSVDDGEFLGILGHNGMGKSTLLKALAGEISATRGSIRFDGKEISRLPSHLRARAGIGYVPQGRQIFPALTVRENMKMAALGGHQPLEIVDRVLARFPRLHPIVDRMGGVLSGGEQQILALARCLCRRAENHAARTNRQRACSHRCATRSSIRCIGCAPSPDLPCCLSSRT